MKKMPLSTWVGIGVSLAVIALFFIMLPLGNSKDLALVPAGNSAAHVANNSVDMNGVDVKDVVVGKGAFAEDGKVLVVHYIGTFTDGRKFDSSKDRNKPFAFILGAGNVIQGWDEGLKGMQVGGRRILTIPPELAYGESGTPNIPPNSTLIFDVTLLDVVDPSDLR